MITKMHNNIITSSIYAHAGQACTTGFPYLNSGTGRPTSSGDVVMTRIIPGMKITCSGTLRRWTADGIPRSNSDYPKLKIFRQVGVNYSFIGEIWLGLCDELPAEKNGRGLYECVLPAQNRLSVQQNDFIGIFLPTIRQIAFDVYFTTTTTDQANRIYTEDVSYSVASSSGAMSLNTPQVNIQIGRPVENDVFPSMSTALTTNTNFTKGGHVASSMSDASIQIMTSVLPQSRTPPTDAPSYPSIDMTLSASTCTEGNIQLLASSSVKCTSCTITIDSIESLITSKPLRIIHDQHSISIGVAIFKQTANYNY